VNVLFVFDDVIGSIKKAEFDARMAQLFMNRRHLIINGTISTIIVSQKYKLIPSRIRSTASWIIFFHLNPRDFEHIYEDAVLLDKKTWAELLSFAFGNDHGMGDSTSDQSSKYRNIGIQIEKNRYFMNFDEIAGARERISTKEILYQPVQEAL
jgi:hypothetical protein